MKIIKIIGLFFLFAISFFYTEKVLSVILDQDEIMIKVKDYAKNMNTNPTNATIIDDTIIPGNTGRYVNINASYKAMKKIGYFEPTLTVYETIYPEISIYNNYNKYLIKGNTNKNNVALIYIINNNNIVENIINITTKYNIKLNLFIDSSYLNNNINILDKLKYNEIYNYGLKGNYTKDNLIISNNIINNKSNNHSNLCLFLKKDAKSLENCTNSKMTSIYVDVITNSYNIKDNLTNGKIYIIDNTKELTSVIKYIISKGYNIVPLSELITE